jgi:hypothetical protein
MKDGWYGDWECAHDSEIEDPDYLDQAITRIKKKVCDSFAGKKVMAIKDESTIIRKGGGSAYRLFDLATLSHLDKGTIAWKGYFKFSPWMFDDEVPK